MAKKKRLMSYIADDAARKASFRQRKSGLIKKVHELSVLCGIEACLIMYSPFMVETLVWPSELAAKNAIARLKSMPKMTQTSKMFNQEKIISGRLMKEQEKLIKQKKQNKEKEEMRILYACFDGLGLQHMNLMDLNNLRLLVERYERDVGDKMLKMTQINNLQPPFQENINPTEIIGLPCDGIDMVSTQGNMISNDGLSPSCPSIQDFPWIDPSFFS